MPDNTPRLIVEPDDGLQPVLDFINSAQSSLLIKQFTFTEPSLVEATIARHRAGVEVRVMLNAQRSGGDRANDETYEQLHAEGIAVQWANPKFYVTHEKSIVVDRRSAMVATYNLMIKYFTLTRDYGIITHDPTQVTQIIDVFDADWDHRDHTPTVDGGLLWSNSNSRHQMARFIDRATVTLHVQHPKFVDAVILDRLVDAVERGVKLKVLCGGKHGISEWDILDTFSSLRTLRRFGAKVHKQKNLRVHAKLIIVDEREALVGSMNIDRSAFDSRRELGLTTDDDAIVGRLREIFEFDWATSRHYDPPDPLGAIPHEDEFPHDHDLIHE
jgi:hypothetical protein